MPASGGSPLTTFHTVWYRHPATRYQPGRSSRAARVSTSVSVWLRRSVCSNRASCSSRGSWPSEVNAGAGFEPGDLGAAGGGGDGQHAGHQAEAVVVEDRVVDGVAAGRGDGAEVVDHVACLQPRGADR